MKYFFKAFKRNSNRRERAFGLGHFAEIWAATYFICQGFWLLGRRVRTPAGEIDLVLKRGRLVVFVEVKARASLDEAGFVITPLARERLARAASAYLARHSPNAAITRLDAIYVGRLGRLRHLPNI